MGRELKQPNSVSREAAPEQCCQPALYETDRRIKCRKLDPVPAIDLRLIFQRTVSTFRFGDALSDASVVGLLPAVKAACDPTKPGFTALADFTEMKLLGLPDVAQKVQISISNAGVRKVASVWGHESFAKIVVNSSAEKVKGGE